ARGIGTNARLLVVSPCCHKELRPQIIPPRVLAPALKHGILLERESEFATDALRAALLEWAGYDTKVFEFISTEHTAKNLMITAVKRRQRANRDEQATRVRDLAAFYGVREQRLASLLGFDLTAKAPA
ncbi:MAG: methyltransferase, partial [Limisphaerales bacterium]